MQSKISGGSKGSFFELDMMDCGACDSIGLCLSTKL